MKGNFKVLSHKIFTKYIKLSYFKKKNTSVYKCKLVFHKFITLLKYNSVDLDKFNTPAMGRMIVT